MVNLDRLYTLYNIISDAKEKGPEHKKEFAEILTGVKGGPGERRLTSQFIARFYTLFPDHQDQALNTLFDLCEDDDVTIRKQAIKDLPTLCKGKTELVPKVADILAQLLQMEDPGELLTVQNSLVLLLKTDSKGTLTGLFYQIQHSEDELVRERCIRFLHSKIKVLGPSVFTTEVENLVLAESKKVLTGALSEEEFVLMMGILKHLRVCKNIKGYQQMVELVSEQVDFTRPLDATDLESVHRLASCTKQALPYFSHTIKSTPFVEYMWREVVPALDVLQAGATETNNNAALILDLLKVMAELVPYAGTVEDIAGKVTAIYKKLMDVMPPPPEGDAATAALEGGVTLEFSRVECLLFIFHQLARNHPEFLTADPERLKDFRTRLQYFARVSQAYQKRLREAVADKSGADLKTEENKIKLIALKTTGNINILIKDLFHQPPSYKAKIALSWKPVSGATSGDMSNGAEKRHTPIKFEEKEAKKQKSDRQIYAPPRDKYSQKAAGGGLGGGGGLRGRNRGRGGGGRGFGSARGGSFRGGFRGRRGGGFRSY